MDNSDSALTGNQEDEPPKRRLTTQKLTKYTYPINPRTKKFKDKFYPDTTDSEWSDWKWQLKHRIKTLEELSKYIILTDNEVESVKVANQLSLGFAITPYYLSLISDSLDDPIRKMTIPCTSEYIYSSEESEDPLDEDDNMKVPGLVHKYPDRVLFMVTKFCSVNCRFCTRSRMIKDNDKYSFSMDQWKNAINYIKNHPEVRDVLLSGGDVLTLPDDKIEWLLSNIRTIPHVEIIRMGTKVPMVLPMRITTKLTNIIKQYHPIYMSIHSSHPVELTEETITACNNLANSGVVMGSQTVLLKGVNDDADVMKGFMQDLLRIRVKPYYIYSMDRIKGSSHFYVEIKKGLEIIESIRGWTSGYANPQYIYDSKYGKIPLSPQYIQSIEGDDTYVLKSFKGEVFKIKNGMVS